MAMASSLNPNAPLFIPAVYRQVEDFSPEWWDLVKNTAWFRDHWFRQHQLHEDEYAAALALPDDLLEDDDLLFGAPRVDDGPFYAPDPKPAPGGFAFAGDVDAVLLKTLASPRAVREQPRHADRPAQYVGAKAGARRVIHQPR